MSKILTIILAMNIYVFPFHSLEYCHICDHYHFDERCVEKTCICEEGGGISPYSHDLWKDPK